MYFQWLEYSGIRMPSSPSWMLLKLILCSMLLWKCFSRFVNSATFLFLSVISDFHSRQYSQYDVVLHAQDENHRVEQHEWLGYNYFFHYFHYQAKNMSYEIWGLTATVLIEAASIVYQRPPDFENSQPKFWGRSRYWRQKWKFTWNFDTWETVYN